MCWSIKTPSISTPTPTVTAAELLPSTNATDPEAAQYGDANETFNKAKGRQALKINLDKDINSKAYNPTNM